MSTDNIFSGKTVEEALNKALRQLNASKEQVKYTVLEEGKSGFLGIGGKPAKIQVELISSDCDLEKRVSDFLKGLFSFLNVEADVSVEEDENTITITLNSNDNAQLIGYRGEILDSLQTLAGAIANKNRETYKRVLINCEGYREKREETLKALAVKLADKAVAKGRKIKLEPMNPFERRIIHSAISDREDVKTESEGKDPMRYVVIIPANLKKREYKKTDRNDRKGGYRKNYSNSSATSAPRPKRSPFGSATFLGNSQKENGED